MFDHFDLSVGTACINERTISGTNNPNVSDASQFHHPPHVPSCRAHQLPNQSAKALISRVDCCSGELAVNRYGTEKGDSEDVDRLVFKKIKFK